MNFKTPKIKPLRKNDMQKRAHVWLTSYIHARKFSFEKQGKQFDLEHLTPSQIQNWIKINADDLQHSFATDKDCWHINGVFNNASNTLLGFIKFSKHQTSLKQRVVSLSDLFVLPKYWNKGIGKTLFNDAVQISQQSGCHAIEFNVDRNNSATIGFYEKLGARRTDETSMSSDNAELIKYRSNLS